MWKTWDNIFKLLEEQKAEVRGCGDVMAVKLVNDRQYNPEQKSTNLFVNYFSTLNINENKVYKDSKILIDIFKNLKKSQEWLAAQDIDTLIQLILLLLGMNG